MDISKIAATNIVDHTPISTHAAATTHDITTHNSSAPNHTDDYYKDIVGAAVENMEHSLIIAAAKATMNGLKSLQDIQV